MSYKKSTCITPRNGEPFVRRGFYCKPDVLNRLDAVRVTYCITDTSGKGRNGSYPVNRIEGLSESDLRKLANRA